MKVLLLSKEGDGIGVANRLTMQGQDVYIWTKDPKFALAGSGISKRVPEWRPMVPKVDLIICDMVGMGKYSEIFQSYGKPVLACSTVLDMLELDHSKGMQLFRAAKIEIPETWDFSGPTEAKSIFN